MNNYGLDVVIWIFCTPLDSTNIPSKSTSAWARETRHWLGPFGSTSDRVCSAWHWPGLVQLDIGLARSTRHQFGLAWLNIGPGQLGLTSAQASSTRHRLGNAQLDNDPGTLGSKSARTRLARHRLDCLGLTWIGPSQNSFQNAIWIIQKCIQSISNPYPIKWIGFKIQKYGFGFEINPFKWIKTNME